MVWNFQITICFVEFFLLVLLSVNQILFLLALVYVVMGLEIQKKIQLSFVVSDNNYTKSILWHSVIVCVK